MKESNSLNRSYYFTRIVFVVVLVELPFDTEVLTLILPELVGRAVVLIVILFVVI
jgi:uncharacterized membrane protein